MQSVLTKDQSREYRHESGDIVAEVRYDDRCGNGHNTFSITGRMKDCSGCIHNKIAKYFPELKPYIKWHLFSSSGPMHYIANVTYHAGNRDYRGLLKGEKRQLVSGATKLPVWEMVMRDHAGNSVRSGSSTWTSSAEKPSEALTAQWEPVWIVGEGKERNLDAARSIAVWPDATDEELTAPGLEERLKARLPALIAEFKEAVESLGFVF